MYSDQIRQTLEEKEIEIGDRIKVDDREGKLMPKPENGDPDTVILKLDSGYNIGLEPEKIDLIEKNKTEKGQKLDINHSEEKPDILVLHTGGTIASRVSYEEGGVKPAFDPEDLVEMYPELPEICNIHSKVVAQMLSEDMEPEHWQEIAEKIDEEKDKYDGIIVGHGTDTMQYTGAALSLMLKGIDTGVILVGSQRSSDRPSSDAAMNLYSAVKFLTDTEFTGIGACMHSTTNDDRCSIMPGNKIRKMHTSKRDAFEPVNAQRIGTVDYQNSKVEVEQETDNGKEYSPEIELDTEVGYIKIRPGMEPEELNWLKKKGYNGVIIEGTGLGHMPVNSFDDKTQHHEKILEKIEEIAEEAVVVMASQCINGRTNMNVYDAGLKIQEAGVIGAKDMHPELAYVKLMWSLGQADSLDEAEQIMGENIAGEIQERSIYNE
jgi:glutamyl-tRNA(Gln) amidotransferase subunit D